MWRLWRRPWAIKSTNKSDRKRTAAIRKTSPTNYCSTIKLTSARQFNSKHRWIRWTPLWFPIHTVCSWSCILGKWQQMEIFDDNLFEATHWMPDTRIILFSRTNIWQSQCEKKIKIGRSKSSFSSVQFVLLFQTLCFRKYSEREREKYWRKRSFKEIMK